MQTIYTMSSISGGQWSKISFYILIFNSRVSSAVITESGPDFPGNLPFFFHLLAFFIPFDPVTSAFLTSSKLK